VGEGGDEVSVARFIASQRTDYRVPHAKCCRFLGVSESWFYKWRDRPPTPRQARRSELDEAVKASFEDSGGTPGTYGSPRVFEDLAEAGWRVSVNTVAASMARQGFQGRSPKRKRRCLTRPDKRAQPIPDLIKRDFSAEGIDQRWCGDLTEIPTEEGKLYLATVLDLGSRRLPGFALGEHHDSPLAKAALCMAAAVRGGDVAGVIFHTDKGGEYVGDLFARACKQLKVTQSMGRVGSALDNAAAESWNSTLEHELLSRKHFATKDQARREIVRFVDNYNHRRRYSSCEMLPPVAYEALLTDRAAEKARENRAA
jgi:transposase InsO family protein